MPNIISYQDFNSGGYSEHLLNQYRRTLPNSADIVQNMKPGVLCAAEGGMQSVANDIQQYKYHQGRQIPNGFRSVLSSTITRPETKAQVVYNDTLYILYGGSATVALAGGGGARYVNLLFISYNFESGVWNFHGNMGTTTSLYSPEFYQMEYESEDRKLIILAPGDIWYEYYLDDTVEERFRKIKEADADVIFDAFYVDYNMENSSQDTVNLDEFIKEEGLPSTTMKTRVGFFADKFPASVTSTDGSNVTTTSTTNVYNVPVSQALTVNPSRTYLIQPIRKAGFESKARVVYAELDITMTNGIVDAASNAALTAAFDAIYPSSGNAVAQNQARRLGEVFNLTDMQSYVFRARATTSGSNTTISYRWVKQDNYYTRPLEEVLMNSETTNFDLQFDSTDNRNLKLNLGIKKVTFTPPLSTNTDDPSSSSNQTIYFNMRGFVANGNLENTAFTHVRVYRTIDVEQSSGAMLHHIGDFRLFRDDAAINFDSGTDMNFVIPETNRVLWNTRIPRAVPQSQRVGMGKGYPTKLYNWAQSGVVEQDNYTYDSWNLSFVKPDILAVFNGFNIIYKDNRILLTQKYRNSIVGETYWVDENRALQRIPDRVLSFKTGNGILYILTEKGLYTLDSLTTSIGDNSENLGDRIFTYRGFRRNIVQKWESKFSIGDQMFIASDATFMSINDYGELVWEDGTVDKDFGYKPRFAGASNMSWVSTLTRLVITTSAASGILNQTFTCFIGDELYNGWFTYTRRSDSHMQVLPFGSLLRLDLDVPAFLSFPDKLLTFSYQGQIFCLYSNSTGINIVQMFTGNTDNLIVEDVYARVNKE